MSTTYRAVEVARPGLLQLTQRPLKEPTAGQVRIRVEACGVCHSDSATVDGVLPGITFPRVPGHEIVGKIDAIGPGVSGWKIGQRVGVGFIGGRLHGGTIYVSGQASHAPRRARRCDIMAVLAR